MRILGVDPGATTGLSLLIDGEIRAEMETITLVLLWEAIHMLRPNVLVVESFIGGAAFMDASSPLKALAICELYAAIKGVKMTRSHPSILQGKNKPRGLSPHIWSARTHALAYKG